MSIGVNMGYMNIENLYKDQRILMFKECWATEKIHGTSAWITFKGEETPQKILYHPGGAKLEEFVKLFDETFLLQKLNQIFGTKTIKIHGEHYGGKIQGMKNTYGDKHRFTIFDIKVGESWLSFDKVIDICEKLNLEPVYGVIIPATIESLTEERNKRSIQSMRNGVSGSKQKEGIVCRPLIEMNDNKGRIIVKFKNDDFRETKTPREISPEKLKILTDAENIAEEWVTPMRLNHVLDDLKLIGETDMIYMPNIINGMIKDIEKESVGETIINSEVKKFIGKKTAEIYKQYMKHINENYIEISIVSGKLGMQNQYVMHYIYGLGSYPNFGEGLDIIPNENYHKIKIHKDDIDILISKIKTMVE